MHQAVKCRKRNEETGSAPLTGSRSSLTLRMSSVWIDIDVLGPDWLPLSSVKVSSSVKAAAGMISETPYKLSELSPRMLTVRWKTLT